LKCIVLSIVNVNVVM